VADRSTPSSAARLAEQRDDALFLVRHADRRVESLTQVGSGRLNPQAAPLEFDELPAEGDVVARCTLTAAHGGSPAQAHGSIVATLLDEVLGHAVTAAGASGLTVSLQVWSRCPTWKATAGSQGLAAFSG
jgi:hypothetical protein